MDEHGDGGAFGNRNRPYQNLVDSLAYGITDEILTELDRIQKKTNIYIFCNKNQLRQLFNFYKNKNVDLLVWNKTNPIPRCNNKYLSDIEYIFFARDEEERIKQKDNVIYPLVDLGITEDMAKDICINNNLYSPLYNDDIHRDGCWFCNKASIKSLMDVYKNYPDYWKLLLELDRDSPYTFRANGETVHDLDKRFKKETAQTTIFDFM